MGRKKTTEEFIEQARAVHGDKYDYGLVGYRAARGKVKIICPAHGQFEQRACNHLLGIGCPKCGGSARKNKEEFEVEARQIHGNAYDYSNVVYKNGKVKVEIYCKTHEVFFWQSPNNHLRVKSCPHFRLERKVGGVQLSTEEFVSRAKNRWGDRYGYDETVYVNAKTKVKIFCNQHKVSFWQTPANHDTGFQGCPDCEAVARSEPHKLTTKEFVSKAKLIHGDRYGYSQVRYTSSTGEKVLITCRKHGVFSQVPNSHLNGNGCPACSESKGEKSVRRVLKRVGIRFESEKRFSRCRDKFELPFDFYWQLGDVRFLLEYHGKQHYAPVKFFGGKKGFENRQRKDRIKARFAKDNGFHFIVIPYWDYDKISEIIIQEITKATGVSPLDMLPPSTQPPRKRPKELEGIQIKLPI